MHTILLRYSIRIKKWVVLTGLVLLTGSYVQAQVSDTLKTEIDTTSYTEPPAAVTNDGDYYDSDTDEEGDQKREYFIRKEFTGGFADSLVFRKLPSDHVQKLKNDKDFWYADGAFKKQQQQKKSGFNLSAGPAMQTLLWILIIAGFIGFLVIYLANSNASLFRKSRNLNIENDEHDTQDIFSINYQQSIREAEQKGDYRLAIRLMFLQLLRDLSDRNLLEYRQENTNSDYLVQLYNSPLYHPFASLARSYEYTWYGQFEIDHDLYSRIKNAFKNFEFTVKR